MNINFDIQGRTGALVRAGVLSASLLIPACATAVEKPIAVPPPRILPTPEIKSPSLNPAERSLIQLHYPELLNAPLKSRSELETAAGKFNFLNFTNFNLDSVKTRQYIHNLYGLALRQDVLEFWHEGKTEQMLVRPGSVTERTIVLTPSSVPLPKWDILKEDWINGATRIDKSNSFSFVRIDDKQPSLQDPAADFLVKDASMTLYIEICQSVIETGTKIRGLYREAQEQYCNSIPIVSLFKSFTNTDYQKYREFAKTIKIGGFSGHPETSMIIFPEDYFKQTPETYPLISR